MSFFGERFSLLFSRFCLSFVGFFWFVFQKVDCFITIQFHGNLNLILFISFQVLAFLAGLINIFHGMGWYGSFIFWSTFFISGFFLALRVFDVHAGLAAKFGWFVKAEFGYCAIWILLYIIATIYSFIFFGAAMVSISIVRNESVVSKGALRFLTQ